MLASDIEERIFADDLSQVGGDFSGGEDDIAAVEQGCDIGKTEVGEERAQVGHQRASAPAIAA